ncbi:MAG: YbaN family protein [Amaricoccus sp.]|uniref:YbaN family protein n=1 Tax=Amaricoccus sp. TaxID=1872485 RepID=UPI003315948F
MLALGGFFVAVGAVGVVLPVLPTTPFLILAAACFARSSPRFERWLLDHRIFGPLLRDWRARGAIPVRAKVAAVAGSGAGFLMMLAARPGPVPMACAGALILGGLAYVLTRPS